MTTERTIAMEGAGAVNQMTLTPLRTGTLLSIVVTYPNREVRDQALGSGMTGGMETSDVRLEREVLAAA